MKRVAAELGFGDRLRKYVGRSELAVTHVAQHAGLKRERFYDLFDGNEHFRAAWLEMLPPAVELLYLSERAAAHRMRIVAEVTNEASLYDVMLHVGEMIAACGEVERDGLIEAHEAAKVLPVLRRVQTRIAELIAQYERALVTPGGLAVVPGGRR
jgi:hypothetical protein